MPEKANKIQACFTLKPKNIKLLKEKSGIATTSAYLDYIIEQYFSKEDKSS